MRLPVLLAAATAAAALLLTGCTARPDGDDDRNHPDRTSTPIPIPTAAATTSTEPVGSGSVLNVAFNAYDQGVFTSTKDCGCSLRDEDLGVDVDDLYPRGSTVWLVRISVESLWGPNQDGTTRDITGTTIAGRYADRPEAAVQDTQEGPGRAAQLGIPWGLQGMFHGSTGWTLQNKDPRSFLVAYYVPAGSTELDLTVDVPSEPQPTDLRLTVPEQVRKAALSARSSR